MAPTARAAARTAGKVSIGKLAPTTAPRVVLNCVEGWGKTSTGAFAPSPVILCAAGETGYQTLRGAGLVPDIDGAVIETWPDLLATIDGLTADCPYETIILDALDGFESMLHGLVTQRDFDGDSGPKGFLKYHKGYDRAVNDWVAMLAKLDRLHAQGKAILLLSHVAAKATKNPMGEDFDSYVSTIHHKVWAATKRWADAVLFGKFHTVVTKLDGKKKGIGGTDRVLYCEQRDAFDAKNRYGMPAELDIPADPSQVWNTIMNAMQRKG
jgi:hypothetical protein